EKELGDHRANRDALKARWESEKNVIGDIQKLREALELARNEMDRAQRQGELTRVAEFKYGKIPGLEAQLKELEAKAHKGKDGQQLLQEEVTAEEVGEV